ncbi:MAG: TetR/AcrR family transcriptional regulator [Firmicutes bacterium]|nr:TetR/AcrR family transcriptional regulator [Bacillota bacterium]
MNKKEIQRKRTKKYFIDAAKEIIEKKGVKNVTAREVGEKAGYSYATIYNYFDDLNDLFFCCIDDYMESCYEYILSNLESKDPVKRITEMGSLYFNYFTDNPNQFNLIFTEELGKPKEKLDKGKYIPSVGFMLNDALNLCSNKGIIKKENIQIITDLMVNFIHGKLLFYIKREAEDLDILKKNIESEILFLIKKGEN